MKCYLFLCLSLAIQGFAIFAPGLTREKDISLYQAKGSALEQTEFTLHHAPSAVVVRPNAGKGPDKVSFRMRAMNFYGADLKHHTFSLDMVMSIRWTDPRVVSRIPKGLDKLSLSHDQAEKVMWMPGIVVSNRDIEKYEIISASVTIYRSGEVRRVERANTRVMKKFVLASYPFDTQQLDVNIASSKYMADEVVLVPDKESAGVKEDGWGIYGLEGWRTASYETHDGELVKSRGSLQITVRRTLEKYSQDHLLPASICLMISWVVFYFPFANPFITPRLVLSILALVTFTQLILKSSKELPGSAPFNYNDLFNQQIQILMSVTIALNMCSEIAFHTFHKEKIARGLNFEAKFLLPFMSLLNITLILGGGYYHWMTLEHTTALVQAVVVVSLAFYFGYACHKHLHSETQDIMKRASRRLTMAANADLAAAIAADEAMEAEADMGGF